MPTWLAAPGKVLLKRHVRHSKSEPLVDEVDLIHANHNYAFVKFPDGRETTVSTKHLAPQALQTSENSLEFEMDNGNNMNDDASVINNRAEGNIFSDNDVVVPLSDESNIMYDNDNRNHVAGRPISSDNDYNGDPPVRRSTRIRKVPDRLKY